MSCSFRRLGWAGNAAGGQCDQKSVFQLSARPYEQKQNSVAPCDLMHAINSKKNNKKNRFHRNIPGTLSGFCLCKAPLKPAYNSILSTLSTPFNMSVPLEPVH